jgi:Domain of unknown function (DUF4149)
MPSVLRRAADIAAAALLGAGLGVQVFLSFLVAPLTFRLIDRTLAARVVTGLFPAYYLFGIVTTGLALLLVLGLGVAEGRSPSRWAAASLLALMLAGTVYAGQVLVPEAQAVRVRAEAARPGDPAPMEFRRMHRFAVAVNIAVFGVGLAALAMHGVSRAR